MTAPTDLPIASLLDGLRLYLSDYNNALIIAPPGAGKSTALPRALLDQSWARQGLIILLQPRRVAVRSVAGQLARLSGVPLGDQIGYQMRDDVKRSAKTQLLVMTQGVFRRLVLADPELSGVSAVLFDEYHERSLDSDICLALCRDSQASLRSDLKLIVMSATLDVSAMRAALEGFSLFESEGRTYPIETQYLPPRPGATIAQQMVAGVMRALTEHTGSILCFLQGQREIKRCYEAITARIGNDPGVKVCMLYGSQSDKDQMDALSPPNEGQRKIILATDIAETSLTVPGVHSVVDSGLRRTPLYDQRLGLTTLSQQRAGKDRLDQRRGRAGRLAPGLCIRLWPEQEMRAIPATSPPEIETQNLSDLVLACADWGVSNLSTLAWTSPPSESLIARARDDLIAFGFLEPGGTISPSGRAAVQMPLPLDLAAMVIGAAGTDNLRPAAALAVLASEGARASHDLQEALHVFTERPSARQKQVQRRVEKIVSLVRSYGHTMTGENHPVWSLFARSRPHLIAKARSGVPGAFKLSAGRGAFVDPASPLAGAQYLIVGDAILASKDVRIASAWPLSARDVETYLADVIQSERRIAASTQSGQPQVRQQRKLGDILVSEHIEPIAPGPELGESLLRSIQEGSLDMLPWPKAFHDLRARARFAARHDEDAPALTDEDLLARADVWLRPQLDTVSRLEDLDAGTLLNAVLGLQDFRALQALDAFAPTHYTAPANMTLKIDYTAEAGPSVAAKLQAFFGSNKHPTIGNGRVPLVVTLLSPAGRPLQSTKDLQGFWAGSYQEVRRDMRGRYPKHPWPENPAEAAATLKTKARLKDGP